MRWLLLVPLCLGCAASAWPPRLAFGQSESSVCDEYVVRATFDAQGQMRELEERWVGCDVAMGGQVSDTGRRVLGGVAGAVGALTAPP